MNLSKSVLFVFVFGLFESVSAKFGEYTTCGYSESVGFGGYYLMYINWIIAILAIVALILVIKRLSENKKKRK